MKIIRIIALVAICSVLGFNMGVNGCSGQIEEGTDLTSGVNVSQDALDMPDVAMVTIADEFGPPCLLSYVPSDINFYGSLLPRNLTHILDLWGVDNFENADQFRQIASEATSHIKEMVALIADNDGSYAILLRKQDADSTDAFIGYISPLIEDMNASRNPVEQGQFFLRLLDNDTAVFSLSSDLINDIAALVERGEVEQECQIYRVSGCTNISEQPMLYFVARGRTSMLNASLSKVAPDLAVEYSEYVAFLAVDEKDDVFRFSIGIANENSFEAALALVLHLDASNPLVNMGINMLMERFAAGEIQIGGGGGDALPQ